MVKSDILSRIDMGNFVVNLRSESYDIYIGRGSKWGNPFRIGPDGNREEVIIKYARLLMDRDDLMSSIHELKGKRLGCFCKPKACHGDVLCYLANFKLEEK